MRWMMNLIRLETSREISEDRICIKIMMANEIICLIEHMIILSFYV